MLLPRRAAYAAVSLALVVGSAVASGAIAAPAAAPSGGTAVEKCYAALASGGTDTDGYRFCRSVEALDWIAAAACRTPLRNPNTPAATRWCEPIDGRTVSEADIRAYERSWVHRALTRQRELSMGVPLVDIQLPHSHNSFNASSYVLPRGGMSYYPTLTDQDPNQVYSITDQLRMDIRAIEIDVHWVPSAFGTAKTGGYWVTMCHGETVSQGGASAHVGCTIDRPLQNGLAELRRWLDAHPQQFVLLYLENNLDDDPEAHAVTSHLLEQGLGHRVYRPAAGVPAGTCRQLPLDVKPADIVRDGHQVLMVGNCGPGQWNRWVFTRGDHWDESGKSQEYDDADCAHDTQHAGTVFRRFYEESPWLEAMIGGTDRINVSTTRRMVACGVNIIGFDQLEPNDGRLEALVWSWARGEPNKGGGDCAYVGRDGRMHSSDCDAQRHVACRDDAGGWFVSNATVTWRDAFTVCDGEVGTSSFWLPRNGLEMARLVGSPDVATDTMWVRYRTTASGWTPLAPSAG